MHYLEGTISLLLLVQKFFDLSILKNYIEMTKTLKLFMHLILIKKKKKKKVVDDYYVFYEFLFKKSKLCIPKCCVRDFLGKEAHGGGLTG